MRLVKITEQEHLHLLNQAPAYTTLTTVFGPSGVFLSEKSEPWALKALAKIRGVNIDDNIIEKERENNYAQVSSLR